MNNPYARSVPTQFGEQSSIFDNVSEKIFTRKTDAPTSFQAVNSHKIKGELYIILDACRQIQGDFTARELADKFGLDYIMVQKRLSVLQKYGYIDKDDHENPEPRKRDGAMLWRVIA